MGGLASTKSRNNNMTSFKTTASITSTKNNKLGGTDAMSIKSSILKNSLVATADSTGKKLVSNNTKHSGTNSNLYSMIYQNRSKNLVSNYLKVVDG